MRFGVLGPVEAWHADGTRVTLAGERQRLLLAVLLARADRPVAADVLIDALWGEQLPEHPLPALQSQMHRLRRTLAAASDEDGWELETSQPGYVLRLGRSELDSARFDALVKSARTADPADAMTMLDEALSLWRGPAFDGVADNNVTRWEAIRLEEAKLDVVEAWAGAALDAGATGEVTSRLEAFVSENPLRERARELLMRALYVQGRQADALDGYARFRERLAHDLGLEPSARMQELELQILRRELPVPGTPAPRAAPRAPELQPLSRMQVRYVRTPAGRLLATGTIGAGPPLVVCPGWVSSLDAIGSGRDPRSSLLQRLVSGATLTIFDRFGTGLSRGRVDDYGLAASVAELEAVADHVGGPVSVLAMSQAGPLAVTLAAERPDLVSRLVLWGTYADGHAAFPRADTGQWMASLMRTHWTMGSRVFADLYQPGTSVEAVRHLAAVFRESADPDVAAAYLDVVFDIDVSPLLSRVTAPALVIHYRGDRLVPFLGGQQLAMGLPNSTFLPLEGKWHLPQPAQLDEVVEAITEFLAPSGQPVSR